MVGHRDFAKVTIIRNIRNHAPFGKGGGILDALLKYMKLIDIKMHFNYGREAEPWTVSYRQLPIVKRRTGIE
jgi:hypothetical protein